MKALSFIVLSLSMTSCSLSLYRPTHVRPSPAEAMAILTKSVPQFVYVATPAPAGPDVTEAFGRPAYAPPTPFREDDTLQYMDPRAPFGYGYGGSYEYYGRHGYSASARSERRDDARTPRRVDQTPERTPPTRTVPPPAVNAVGGIRLGAGHRVVPVPPARRPQ